MPRLFILIPNRAFDSSVKQYAFFAGKPIFTVRDLDSALINYTYHARKLN